MIDLHCHLDLYPDPEKEVDIADAAGIYVLSVTTTPSAWRATSALAQGRRRIKTALGLHPQLAHERQSELPLFEKLLGGTRYVGEIGLDGSEGYGQHANDQRNVFERILRMTAEQGGRILTIHSRRAVDEVLARLDGDHARRSVLHWFTGTQKQLVRATDMGCWFSVGPAMLSSARGLSLVAKMPMDRVLTETDGPFAKRNGRILRPSDSWLAVDGLATIWEVDRLTASEILKSNLRRLTTEQASMQPQTA